MNYEIKIYDNFNQLDLIRETWHHLLQESTERKVVERDFDYFKFRLSKGILIGEPLIFVLEKEDKPFFICIGIIEDISVYPSLAYFKFYFLRMKKKRYHIQPYGIFGNTDSEELIDKFITDIVKILKERRVDYIFFNLLQRHTASAQYLLKLRHPLMRDYVPSYQDHYILDKPLDFKTFLSTRNKHRRHEFRRLIRNIENDSEIRVVLKIFTNPEDLELVYNDVEKVACKSQLRALNVGFKPSAMEFDKMKWLALIGYFRCYIVYVNDVPGSFLIGYNYYGNYFLEYTGVAMEFEKYSLGTYMYLKVIEDLSISGFAERIDFSHGPDRYKKSLSSQNIPDIRIKLYIPKISNLIFIINISFNSILNKWTRALLKKIGLYEILRKRIREKFKQKLCT